MINENIEHKGGSEIFSKAGGQIFNDGGMIDFEEMGKVGELGKKEMWSMVLARIAPMIDRGHLLTIFVNSAILSVSNGVMIIGFASIIGPEYVRQRYHEKILNEVKLCFPEINEVKYELKTAIADHDYIDKLSLDAFMNVIGGAKKVRKVPNKQEVLMDGGMRSKVLNPKYTLRNFISGSENKLVHAACQAVSAKPGGIYNPLYIYGGVGLGKTHLLQATGQEILKNFPGKRVVYMTAEHFINKIIEAIGKKHTKPFKDEYRNLDCLIVDDIQFFANKATSEQEFFHTFNDLYDNQKQIILSADKSPRELSGLDDRLRSRFGMGMLIEISMPSFETRLAILQSKCKEYLMVIDREVLEFIAFNITTSVREMIGVLVTAIGEAQLEQSTPTIRSIAEIIRRQNREHQSLGVIEQSEKKSVVRNAQDVIEIVSKYFGLTKSDLIGEERKKEIMIARQICMFLIREILDMSYESIGEYFSGRNHTTVMHACNKIINQMKNDGRLNRDILGLKKKLGF